MDNTSTTVFSTIHSVHFVGIKGIAMTALAVWAKQRGLQVSGSDTIDEFPSDAVLKKAAISVLEGFSAEHVSKSHTPDLVIYTGAHGGQENIEVVTAVKMGIPVLPHGKALGIAMQNSRQISVAGSHGKTTTSAMVATILSKAGLDPSYTVGSGEIGGLGLSGHFGKGEYFVAESDEYITDPKHDKTPRFLWQHPEILVVTNIDYDHPDAYASLAKVQDAFVALKKQQVGRKITIINNDDAASSPMLFPTDGTTITYGQGAECDYQIHNVSFPPERTVFALSKDGMKLEEFELFVPGIHNAYNAAAAAVACHEAGLSWEKIKEGLKVFTGAKRRFEKIAFLRGITIYDDYAHHPKEIKATLKAARLWYEGRRIIAIFQPHTYTRTIKLLSDFGTCFSDCDVVVLTDIYASARENITTEVTGQTLVNEVKKNHQRVVYAPGLNDVKTYVLNEGKEGDVIFFIGAGDIFAWEKVVCDALRT